MNEYSKTTRNRYIERFGSEKVEWACRKANWHKTRALKWGLELHFSAWQWLDLCDSIGWKCGYCGQNKPLEPHHRHELHKGGLNTCENLDAICKGCHELLHQWPDDVSSAWMTYQNALWEKFRRIALECGAVRLACGTREENQTRSRGVLMEFHAPQMGQVPLRGLLPRGDWKTSEPFAPIDHLTQDWWDGRASAQVQWHAGGMWEERVILGHLAAVEKATAPQTTAVPRSAKRSLAPQQFALTF